MSNKLQQPQETMIKVITLGPPNSGKTSLILRLTQDRFQEVYLCTIGVDFGIKRMYVNNEPVKLQIWDTAGQERFRTAISKAYYRNAHGIIFAFDITSMESFEGTQKVFEKTMEEIKGMDQNMSYILVGCKNDLEERRAVSFDVAMAFAESLGMQYIETSAKMNRNCLEVADTLGKLCLEQIKNKKIEQKPQLVEAQVDYKKSTCC